MDFALEKMKGAKEHSAKFYLHRHLTRLRPNRSKLKIHASDLYGDWETFCPRERALRWLLQQDNEPERFNSSLRMTFELGKMVHDFVVQSLALEGVGVGDWECVKCGHFHFRVALPGYCQNCQGPRELLRHKEISLVSPISNVSGAIDCFFDRNTPGLTPVEIKSIDKEEFKGLVMPKAEHRWRTQLYLRILAEAAEVDPWVKENVNTDEAIVLYVSKGGFGCADPKVWKFGFKEKFSPFKEYIVKRNDANNEAAVKQAIEYKDYRDFMANHEATNIPTTNHIPKPICGHHKAKRAAKCAMRDACFGSSMEEIKL